MHSYTSIRYRFGQGTPTRNIHLQNTASRPCRWLCAQDLRKNMVNMVARTVTVSHFGPFRGGKRKGSEMKCESQQWSPTEKRGIPWFGGGEHQPCQGLPAVQYLERLSPCSEKLNVTNSLGHRKFCLSQFISWRR